jgi:hypothetical protein
MAHHTILNVPLLFRFFRVPTVWRILDGAEAVRELESGSLRGGFLADADRVTVARIQFDKAPTELDGWACRKEFFKLPQRDDALLKFLNKCGLWWSGDPWRTHVDAIYTVGGRFACEPHLSTPTPGEIWKFREELREALKSPAGFISRYASSLDKAQRDYDRTAIARMRNRLEVRFELDGTVPRAVFSTITCEEMLLVTVYADLIRGFRFRYCKRKDCGSPFAVHTKHKRKFCTQYCGHLESIRNKRRHDKYLKRLEAK